MTAHQFHRSALMSITLALLIAGVCFVTEQAAAAKDGGLIGFEGTLTQVDPGAGTVTILTRRQQVVVITTGPGTKIERNERRATLAVFKLGDRVEAKLVSAGASTAAKVEATGP